jgi:peptide/nickel transport system permease protein
VNERAKLWLSAGLLVGIHLMSVPAGFLAPYGFASQNRDLPFAPPIRLHFVDAQGKFHAHPFIYALSARPAGVDGYEEDRSQIFPIRLFVPGDAYTIAGVLHLRRHLFGASVPARVFLLGSDEYGRDQFSRLLYGGQISLFAGLLAAGISLGLGLILGSLAGFYGKWGDEALMRGAELFLTLPWLYLLLAVRAFLPLHITPLQAFFLLTVVIGFVGWARPARLVRGVVLSAKQRGYVLAARGLGASDFYLLRRHVLPETYGLLLTHAALLVPQYILAEVTLSFLGLGVSEPFPSWGNMLASLQKYYVLEKYWWMFAPGLALMGVFLLYYMLSDTLHKQLKNVRV